MVNILNHYLSEWQLSHPYLLAETPTSTVYTVTFGEKTAVLKLLTPLGEQDELNGILALQYFAGQGAVQVWQSDAHACLMEFADGDNLVPLVKNGEDIRATQIIAAVIGQLHSIQAVPPELMPLKTWFRSLFKRADDPIFQNGAKIAQNLLDHPQREVVLHGDIHHENIRHSGRGWLAFDPKGIYGECTYDTANTLCNPVLMPDVVLNKARLLKNAEILAEALQVDLNRLLQFTYAYACLSASWSMDDGQEASLALGVAQILESIVNL